MSQFIPNYSDFGASFIMGPKLRTYVEQQLKQDLSHYITLTSNVLFDWSETCGEGNSDDYLDGTIENFSAVAIFDIENNLLGEGWIDFILDRRNNNLIVYWDDISIAKSQKAISRKADFGIPRHIWDSLDDYLKKMHGSKKQIDRPKYP